MNLKENVRYIREEMVSDEKMLEGLLRFESWLKRYKNILIGIAVLIVIFVAGYVGNQYYQAAKEQKIANDYAQALKGNTTSIESLKNSQSKLYDLYQFQKALQTNDTQALKTLESSKDPLIAQFAKIQKASLESDFSVLNTQSTGDFGHLQAAFLEIQKGNLQSAREILTKIPNDSPIKDLANALEHLSIKGIKNAQ